MSERILARAPEKGTINEWTTFDMVEPGLAFGRLEDWWLPEANELLHKRISEDSASLESFRAVQHHNPDSFWGLWAREGERHALVGFYCQLILNEAGHCALLRRAIALKNPDARYLCSPGEKPAAIYIWATVAERKFDMIRPMLARSLGHYSGIPYYATLATEAGFRAGKLGGMRPVTPDDDRIGGLFVLKLGYSHKVKAPDIQVVAVTTTEQLEQARAVRAVVFMGEQKCPYAEEFDGNDLCATHILGLVDGEPAGCARVRYFGEFAKIERLSVLSRYRRTELKYKLVAYVEELVRRKGYNLLYGHPQQRILTFWTRLGYEEVRRNASFRFSDHDYTEMRKFLPPHPDRLTLHDDPMVLVRPEGDWEREGVLERSASRPVTRPC
jgi:predicted GNAT family N-acyltransferase